MAEQPQNLVLPSIIFEIGNNLFSVNSKYIAGIMKVPEYTTLPDAPPEVKGMFKNYNGAVIMLDLRAMLKMRSRNDEFKEFCDMIDSRKAEHIRWVDTLEQTTQSGARFPLATDPHKCALGRWCDNFQSDISDVNFHLKKIFEPHTKLHECAVKIGDLQHQEEDNSKRQASIKHYLQRARQNYMPRVVSLLDEMKDVFHLSVFHEMALVLSHRNVSIVVDRVLSVEDLQKITDGKEVNLFLNSPYVKEVQRSEKLPGLILELDVLHLLDDVDIDQLDQYMA